MDVTHEGHVDRSCSCNDLTFQDYPGNMFGDSCVARTELADAIMVRPSDTLDYLMWPAITPFDGMCLWDYFAEQQSRTPCAHGRCRQRKSENDEPAHSHRHRAWLASDSHPQFAAQEVCMRHQFVVPALIGDAITLQCRPDHSIVNFVVR